MNDNVKYIGIKPLKFQVVNEELNIKIKYLNDEIPRLNKITKGDWIDLYAAEDIIINKNEFKLINLGVAMQLPEGYEAQLLPRSSTFKNWGIIMTNSIGIIDETYCGDNDYWKFPAYCLVPNTPNGRLTEASSEGYTKISKGDKIAQFRIIEHMPGVSFEEVDSLNNKDRGGFGTTGTK